MEQQSNEHKSEGKGTSKDGTMENLTYTATTKSAAQNQPSNQTTEDLTSNGEKANETYIVDSDNPEHHTSFISMTTPTVLDKQLISICSCLLSDQSFNLETDTQNRKFTDVQIAETYLRVRRIPELIRLYFVLLFSQIIVFVGSLALSLAVLYFPGRRKCYEIYIYAFAFILTKILCSKPQNVQLYVADLLDECMCFRAGLGKAPVLFEERHLEAVIKSFDPGDRGWLTAGQVRRAYTTLGLTPKSDLEVRTPTTEVLHLLRKAQEHELLSLLTAGMEDDEICDEQF